MTITPQDSGAIPSVYTETGSAGRQATLRRLRSGGVKLDLSAPAKDGTRRVYAFLDLSERWAIETLMMLEALCAKVDRLGLPTLPSSEAADAA